MNAGTGSHWWLMAQRLWQARPDWLGSFKALRERVVDILVIAVAFTLFIAVVQQALDPSPVIEPISVPKSGADLGYTGEVAAARLIDVAREIERQTNASTSHSSAAAAGGPSPLLAVTVPGAGVSLAVVVEGVRRMIGLPTQRIGGDIVAGEKDGHVVYRMTVRVSEPTPRALAGDVQPSIDAAIDDGARRLTELLRPCAEAALRFQVGGAHDADFIRLMPACYNNDVGPDRAWARNLRGLSFFADGQYDNAIAEYQKALTLAPGYANALGNLAQVLCTKGDFAGGVDILKRRAGVMRLAPAIDEAWKAQCQELQKRVPPR